MPAERNQEETLWITPGNSSSFAVSFPAAIAFHTPASLESHHRAELGAAELDRLPPAGEQRGDLGAASPSLASSGQCRPGAVGGRTVPPGAPRSVCPQQEPQLCQGLRDAAELPAHLPTSTAPGAGPEERGYRRSLCASPRVPGHEAAAGKENKVVSVLAKCTTALC